MQRFAENGESRCPKVGVIFPQLGVFFDIPGKFQKKRDLVPQSDGIPRGQLVNILPQFYGQLPLAKLAGFPTGFLGAAKPVGAAVAISTCIHASPGSPVWQKAFL